MGCGGKLGLLGLSGALLGVSWGFPVFVVHGQVWGPGLPDPLSAHCW